MEDIEYLEKAVQDLAISQVATMRAVTELMRLLPAGVDRAPISGALDEALEAMSAAHEHLMHKP